MRTNTSFHRSDSRVVTSTRLRVPSRSIVSRVRVASSAPALAMASMETKTTATKQPTVSERKLRSRMVRRLWGVVVVSDMAPRAGPDGA